MSTVLTKPVLLDETGQAIVGKLEDIKNAIDNGGTEKYPVLIHITSMPTKTDYIAGEQLNLAGIVVKAVFSNNVEYDVTDQCTFSPANGTVLTSSDTSVTATYTWHPTGTSFTATQAITVKGIVGISVATPPTKTDYIINETLDLTGMVVHLNYDDNTYDDITSDCTYVPADGATLDDDTLTTIAVSYIDALGRTWTATQNISVIAPIYGVEWEGTASPTMTRTGLAEDFTDPVPYYDGMTETPSSPFDNIMPWSGMRIVDDAQGKFVEIPKFYYKISKTGSKMKFEISMVKLDGFRTSPAHQDRNDGQGERDYVYIARYYMPETGLLSSTTDRYGKYNLVSARSRCGYNNVGNEYWLFDYAMWWTLTLLMIVEYATWNVSAQIGMTGNTTYNNGVEDMPYHTGTMATQKVVTQQYSMQYRYIVGIFEKSLYYIDGIFIDNNGQWYAGNNPAKYKNYPTSDDDIKIVRNVYDTSTTGGAISEWYLPTLEDDKYNFALVPQAYINTSSSSWTDYCSGFVRMTGKSTGRYYFFKGGTNSTDYNNPCVWTLTEDNSSTTYLTSHSARAIKLPNNT